MFDSWQILVAPSEFKKWRQSHSYSQEDVALMLDLPVSTIQRFEAGYYGRLTLDDIKKPLN